MQALEDDYTAIFAMADLVAIGAVRGLKDRGLRVPEDVSLMGLDGLPLGDYLVPRLATVGQDVEQMARRGVELLLAAMETGAPATHEIVPFRIKQLESIRKV